MNPNPNKMVELKGESNEGWPLQIGFTPVLFKVYKNFRLFIVGEKTGHQSFDLTAQGEAIWQAHEQPQKNGATSLILQRMF